MFHRLAIATLALAAAGSAKAEMTISSPDIRHATFEKAQVLNGFGCTGGNLSPALAWQGAPEGTKSFAVTLYDPDAPTGSGWWHWTVFNIPAGVTELPAGATAKTGLPAGAVEGRTDFGKPGYGGACPPEGAKPHRYEFRVYALRVETLPLDQQASGAMVGFYLKASSLAEAKLEVSYGR
nr:YbhB/YbcL family Raf kinase inhibitor-like protein [uncultured Gellertiella sp.]